MTLNSAAIALRLLMLFFPLLSAGCRHADSSLRDLTTPAPVACSDLRELLRAAGGGVVDIYEDDYASFIRASPRYAQFAHMPMDELVAIRAYTHRFWQDLNAALWNNSVATLPAVDQAVLHCALAGLKRMTPANQTTFRQTNLTATALERHVAGTHLRYPAFTSTTTDPAVLVNFPGNTRFTIEIGAGYAIAWLSEHPEEAEVLIPPGRCFLVVDRLAATCPATVAGPCWHIKLRGAADAACDSAP